MSAAREKEDDGPTAVVLTASDLEFDAVESLLAGDRASRARDGIGTLYRLGWLDGTPWRIALAEIGTGNGGAAVVATHAVERFRPRLVMFVGVAGGLKEGVAVGDVVVATKVYGVHGGKDTGGGFHARPESWQLSHEVRQTAAAAHRRWRRVPGAPPVHFKPVAAGEVVLEGEGAAHQGSAHQESAYRERLRRTYEDAVALETESAGMAQAAHMHRGWPALTVRGITDRTDRGRETAARNAAAFALEVVRELRDDEEETDAPEVVEVPAEAPRGWRAGAVVEVGGMEFLLEDGLVGQGEEGEYWGRALLAVPASRRRADHVWVRRVDTPGERREALRREFEFLAGTMGSPRLPHRHAYELRADTALLALWWPASKPSQRPAVALADVRRTGPVPGSAMSRTLLGCASLAESLDVLHREGHAHRCLSPQTVLHDGTWLWLRDLGSAFHAPHPGEGHPAHRAPEQECTSYRPDLIGPPADIYQLASLTYQLLTGAIPDRPYPLPLRTFLQHAPDPLDDILRAALNPIPAARFTALDLAAHLRRSATLTENPTPC
ncbi:hypothetical protein IAG44_06535 [Streptomyces roseirectus]|uniref:Protein kinase domain-containing protein n=1 Tax=Streptomyces roseirectus TaxID=2768066 RepID=A0A7H0I8L6_9ACTN|nr:hypothetical protein [Streptomyces roseirectus]QNP69132.1 hypothetical protein IAG44_06535 [Streptomyces roseirectus]